jgi:hypothetical protein
MHTCTHSDLLEDGLQECVVLGKIAKNFVILGQIDEDRESVLGYALTETETDLSVWVPSGTAAENRVPTG